MAYDDRYYDGAGNVITQRPEDKGRPTNAATSMRVERNNGALNITGSSNTDMLQQSPTPTSVASVNNAVAAENKPAQVMRNKFQPDEQGLRAVLDPYGSRGFRNISRDEKNQMQQTYRDLANMKGLSNRQRQTFLLQQKEQMAKHGLKPTFDLSSDKGLSQRQIAANRIGDQAINTAVLDNQARIGGANNMHNYNRDKFWDEYRNWLLEW